MKYFRVVFWVILSAGCRREIVPIQAPPSLMDQTRDFLSWFHSQDAEKGTFNLEDSVSVHFIEMRYFLNACLSDSLDFTPAERDQIAREIGHPGIALWTQDWVKGATIIPKRDIDELFSGHGAGGGWEGFYKRYGNSYSDYSKPIFLRDNSLCLFYSGNHCGWLCGYGALVLYRRDGNEWKVVRTFGSWVS